MTRKLRIVLLLLGVVVALATTWFVFGTWPDPEPVAIPWTPDAILILGGGDAARVRQGKLLADEYPGTPVIVSGDGGVIVRGLVESGISASRILHEKFAESTMDNAVTTAPIMDRLDARRVVLVTNWFHIPRAMAVFRKKQPEREFAASFESEPESVKTWERPLQRRERMASMLYLLRYGVWSW